MMQNAENICKQEKIEIFDLFNGEAYRTYQVDFAKKIGSILAAILYSELVGRQKYHKNLKELIKIPDHGEGWFYYTREKGMDRLGMSIQEQRTALSILLKNGLVEKVSYGLPCKTFYRLSPSALLKFLDFSNNISRDAESTNRDVASNKLAVQNQQTAHNTNEPKEEPKEDTLSHQGKKAPPAVAIAPEREVSSSQDFPAEETKVPVHLQLTPSAKEVSSQMISSLQKHSVTFRAPKSMVKFDKFVRLLIDEQKQDPKTVMAVFNYALADTEERNGFKGWSPVMYAGCPSEKLYKHFVSIDAQMKSRPKSTVDRRTKNMDGTPVDIKWKF